MNQMDRRVDVREKEHPKAFECRNDGSRASSERAGRTCLCREVVCITSVVYIGGGSQQPGRRAEEQDKAPTMTM
jgi:hypothetical protein